MSDSSALHWTLLADAARRWPMCLARTPADPASKGGWQLWPAQAFPSAGSLGQGGGTRAWQRGEGSPWERAANPVRRCAAASERQRGWPGGDEPNILDLPAPSEGKDPLKVWQGHVPALQASRLQQLHQPLSTLCTPCRGAN
jgi:hypothetical protein